MRIGQHSAVLVLAKAVKMDYNAFYELGSLDEVLGEDQAIAAMRSFASKANSGTLEKPLILFGPTGVGKSTSARLLAAEYKWNLIELNASDYRDKDSIKKILGAASQSRSLFNKMNLILLDEIDDISAKFDKGASSAILDLINTSKNPIIFIANDVWDQKISFLRGHCTPVEFKKPKPFVIEKILERISARLSIKTAADVIRAIAARSSGDVRSAINDMFAVSGASADALDYIGLRDRKEYIFSTLDKIFMSNTLSAPLRAITNAEDSNDMLLKWIDQNIPNRYSDMHDIRNAYASLSCASIYFNKASRSQYYTYWRYTNVLMSSGVALAKSFYPQMSNRYEFPHTIKSLSSSKGSRASSAEIAAKLKRRIHESTRKILEYYVPILAMIAKQNEAMGKKNEIYDFFETHYELSEKDIEFIKSSA